MTLRSVRVLLLLVFPAAAPAQTISGVVLEENGSTRVAGAAVELVAPGGEGVAQTTTDNAGMFVLRPGRAGVFIVRLTHPSYVAVVSDTVKVAREEALILQLRMSPSAIPLAPLEVVARGDPRLLGFYHRMQRGGAGRFLSREELESRPGARVTHLLQHIPGIYVVSSGTAAGEATLAMRSGARNCTPRIYVDGNIFPGPLDSFLMPSILEGVEIYTRPVSVPSEFVSDGDCGVIAFWTRPGTRGRVTWGKAAVVAAAAILAILLAR